MRVAVRCDASPELGLGHVKRCLALSAFLLERGANVSLIFRESVSRVRELAEGEGVSPVAMKTPRRSLGADSCDAQLDDAREAVAALGGRIPDWFIVDHYSLDATWHEYVRARGARVCVIDDLGNRPLLADVLVDPNLTSDYRAKYRSILQDHTILLGGPRFAPIAKVYSASAGYVFREQVKSVGVFLGGGTVAHLCRTVWRAIREAGYQGPVEIVVSSADPGIEDLRRELAADALARILVDQRDLCAFFATHDLQIGAGGSAVWERCAMGAASLLLQVAANQQATLAEVQRLGIAETLSSPSMTALKERIQRLLRDSPRRREMNRLGPLLVDGRGGERIGLVLRSEELSVRRATRDDAPTMLAWRNHPITRESSRNTAIIREPDHVAWLDRVLDDPRRRLLVGEIAGKMIGVIRFDEVEDRVFEVSLYLEPGLHGLGLGRRLLGVGEQLLRSELPTPYSVRAEVLPGNSASRKLFERGGYAFVGNIGLKAFSERTGQ